MKKLYFLVTIDTECDKKSDWSIQKPLRFASVLTGIPGVLTPFFDSLGIRPTYLLSPEILQNEKCVQVLKNISNCEFGTHLHGEFLQPQAVPDPDTTDTPPCGYPPQLERDKLEELTRLFTDVFGYPPRSFRAGRFGLSPSTFSILESSGYTSDSSVTPFRNLAFSGACAASYWGAPVYSYPTSPNSLIRAGRQRLREIPVSLSIPRLQNWPLWLLRLVNPSKTTIKKIFRRLGVPVEPVWIRPFRMKPDELALTAAAILDRWPKDKPAFINVMFHSVEIIPGASPYAASQQDVEALIASLETLFKSLAQTYRLIPATMSEFCDEN